MSEVKSTYTQLEYAEYKKYLESLADRQSSSPFYNSNNQHGAAVFSTMFNNAKNEFLIFAGSMDGSISSHPDYKKALKHYIDSNDNSTLKIIVQEYKPESHIYDLLRVLSSSYPKRIEISKNANAVVNAPRGQVHFAIADNKMYRLETDTTHYEAVGNFNDVNMVTRLKVLFGAIHDESTKVNIFEID